MEENDNLSFKDRTLDELIGHLASDVQGDGQFNHLRFTPSNTPPVSRIGQEFPNEVPQNFIPQRNLFFQENYQSHQRGSLPFIFNTREDVLPAMVDVGGGNYVVYETANAQRNQNIPNVHFIKKTNGTLSGFNDYGVEYTGMDYNLFQGVSPQRHSVSQYHQTAENNMKAQLIENLVGNWASDQTGTYSPFGSSLGGVRASDIADNVGIGRGSRKTRIVAEVRPMRPSYSDVLSKSITNNQKPNNKTSQEVKQKTNDAKIKTLKSSIGRTLSGNGNILNRQHSAVIDDSNLTGLNTPLKGNSFKKSDSENEVQEGLSKKWLSLDDLKDATRQDDYININDVKNKKNSPKNINNKGSKKEKFETTQLNNAKNFGSKPSVSKKPEKINVKLQNNMTKEKENIPGPKPEPVKPKTSSGEERRGPVPSQSKSDQQKSARRNGRPSQPEKHRKSLKGKRKDQDLSLSAMIKNRIDRYGGVLLFALRWLLHLVLDVLGLSIHLALHMCAAVWASAMLNTIQFYNKLSHSVKNIEIFQRIINSRFNPFKKAESKKNIPSDSDEESDDSGDEPKVKRKIPRGLKHNISLPVTGEEAMKRLLACKGKDPYSILGVTQDCTDDDIKKYYKRQAFLVHPDKNNQPGAEEAFKILVHAFDIIGEPEHRKSYDRTVEKTQVEQAAWSELSDLLSQLHKKMEYVANTIRCTNCNKRHKRTTVDRPIYAARMCGQCKIHHSVREGDIWAETSLFGFLWHYYACMDGAVYDITEWAGCQGSNLRNLKANTHNVQYRIVLGKQPGQKQRYQHPAPTSEPDFEDFLNNLYTKTESGSQGPDADVSSSTGGRKRKTKKKK